MNSDDINLFEIRIGKNTITKEYKKNEFFIDFYDISKGGVTITPIGK